MATLPPLPEDKLWDLINQHTEKFRPIEERLWEMIRIPPVRWQEHHYGGQTGGFWAVAVFGQQVIWYNEIEEGFNLSNFHRYGEIAEYWCDQLNLDDVVVRLTHALQTGGPAYVSRMGPPQSLE